MNMLTKIIIRTAIATGLLLMVPLVAMQFTNEVNWSVFDFLVMGALIFTTGTVFQLILRKSNSLAYKLGVSVAIGSVFFFIWANLGVGLIGGGPNAANLMYIGVLAVGIVGAVFSNFTPAGLERTMYAMAASMVIVAVIQFIIGAQNYPASSVQEVLMVNGFFTVLFGGSGLLFRAAAEKEPEHNHQAE